MKMKVMIKKGIAWILTTAMVAAMVPVMAEQVQAEESQA